MTATFYNFAPAFVARRVPAVWDAVTPAAALEARLAGVDAASGGCSAGVDRLAEAVEAAELAGGPRPRWTPGRPLAAANAGLPVSDEPHLALWQALTTLREHRGDGHAVALLQREVDGVGAHVLAAAAGRSTREWLRGPAVGRRGLGRRGPRLTERGWLDDGELTAQGLAVVAAIEADTDRLALGPWRALGDAGCDRLAELLARAAGGRRGRGVAGPQPDRRPRPD